MNQATVIAGFCEIIENLLKKQHYTVNEAFFSVLQKVEELVRTFNDTLSVFRTDCVLIDMTDKLVLSLDPAADITGYLSESCKMHFGVLRDIAGEIERAASSITPADIGIETIGNRYSFVADAAVKLHDLFLHPVAFLQRAIREHQS